MSFKFIVYSTPTCPYCDMAKNLIVEQGMSYAEASLDTPEAIDEFKKTTGHNTVPQIYLATEEQEYIGGYDDLEKFMLEMVDWRRQQVTMGNPAGGYVPQGTVTIREHGNNTISVKEENRVGGYNINISDSQTMKDITPLKE